MIKVVVADIDGTLCDINHILTQETYDTLNSLLNSDIKVGIATGRQVTEPDSIWQSWNLDKPFDFYIGMNGAMLHDSKTNTLTCSHLMDYNQAMSIIEHMKPLGLGNNFYCDDDVHYVYGKDEQTIAAKKRHPELNIQDLSEDYRELVDKKIFRILFRVERGKMDEVLDFIKKNPLPKGFEGFQTQPICYEVMLEGVNKATGLKEYCDRYNITMDEVYAFGDTSNDVEMLECCHGVCLCDGTDDAKEVSEFITDYPCKESGFARFVKEHIL